MEIWVLFQVNPVVGKVIGLSRVPKRRSYAKKSAFRAEKKKSEIAKHLDPQDETQRDVLFFFLIIFCSFMVSAQYSKN